MLVVLPDVPRVDPFLRVDGGQPLAVRVPSELAGKYTVRPEPGERDRTVGSLAARNMTVSPEYGTRRILCTKSMFALLMTRILFFTIAPVLSFSYI